MKEKELLEKLHIIKKYRIDFIETNYNSIIIEADNYDEAIDKFNDGDFDVAEMENNSNDIEWTKCNEV